MMMSRSQGNGKLLRRALGVLICFAITDAVNTVQGQSGTDDRLFPVCQRNSCGYIDTKGSVKIPLRLADAKRFSEGLAPVRVGIKWGYINTSGNLVIEAQFYDALSFSENLAAVEVDHKWGFIDRFGKMVINPQFDEARSFSYGFANIRIGLDWSYVDLNGRAVPISFYGPPEFSNGLSPIIEREKIGYVDQKLTIIIEPKFIDAGHFSEGLATAKIGDQWGYIDRTGNTVIPYRYNKAERFSEGFAAVAIGSLMGYIDTFGRITIAPRFCKAFPFSEGLAAVIIDGQIVANPREHTGLEFVGGRWGYVNKEKRVALKLSPRVDYAGEFVNGIAAIRLSNGKGWVYR